MIYPLVRDLADDGIPVTVTCRVLKISRQPYYRWLDRPVSDAELDEAWLANAIFDAHRDDPEFGYRLLADEVRAAGHEVSDRVLWRICRDMGWWSVFGKPKAHKSAKPGTPAHDDLVRRRFNTGAPNEIWVADITEHRTAEGKVYLCAIKDLFSNRIVGWAIDSRMKARLVVAAVEMAVSRRDGDVAGCIFHTDRGSQAGLRTGVRVGDQADEAAAAAGGEPGGQGGRHRRRGHAGPVRDLPQPRGGRTRQGSARQPDRPARRRDRRKRQAHPQRPGSPRRRSPPAGLRRFLRRTPGGLLRIDRSAIRTEQRLDGKFLLRTSDPTLSAEDIALGYKQLLEVERGWRDMKSTLELRPVYHRLEGRIRAHVILCWLALLLIRIAETTSDHTWRNLRHELDRMHLGTFTGAAGTVRRRTTTTPTQAGILQALDLPEPREISDIRPARPAA